MRQVPSTPLRNWLVLVAVSLALPLGCCKSKGGEDEYVPPPRKAWSTSDLMSICEDGKPYGGNPAYVKKSSPATPSKVAVFRKYRDDQPPTFKIDEHTFGAIDGTSSPGEVELVACLELERKGEPLFCNYHGATIKVYDMNHKVKIVEAATGKVVGEHTFDMDRLTEKCPGTAAGDSYRGTDYSNKLLSLLLPLQPEGIELPKIQASDLDAVCSGGAFPQAAPMKDGPHGPVHIVYFPTATQSFTREDLPSGLESKNLETLDVSQVQLVACVTGKPEKKKRSCNFTAGKVLELHDGEFEVALYEARTGKLVEKKMFRGTAGTCPVSYKFFRQVDQVMTRIDPGFKAYIKKLEKG